MTPGEISAPLLYHPHLFRATVWTNLSQNAYHNAAAYLATNAILDA